MERLETPICLVENSESGGLKLRPEAVHTLAKIELPLVVVAIAGPARTGKSFLMNRLMGVNSGFELGATVECKTKGIWAWGRRHPIRKDQFLLLLDTEGLGDVRKSDANNDNWIFALAVLLSSTFVYNCIGALHEGAIEKLHYVTELTELIKVRSDEEENDGEEFCKFFPNFVWTLRDWTLALEIDGKPVTEDEYLQYALKLKEGTSKKINDYNLPRECILKFFGEKKVFVFQRPVEDSRKLHYIETLDDKELNPSFLQSADRFCHYILTNSPVKTVSGGTGCRLTGSSIGSLLETYIECLQSGKVPCMENAVRTMMLIENKKAVQKALDHYKSSMDAQLKLPTSTQEELDRMHFKCNGEALQMFMRLSVLDDKQEYQQRLKVEVEQHLRGLNEENRRKSSEQCRTVLDHVSEILNRNASGGLYNRPGGYKAYRDDLERTIQAYESTPGKGVMAQEVLAEFVHDRQTEGALILASDTALTEKEKEKAAEILKREESERQKELADKRLEDMQEEIRVQEETFEQNVQEVQKKLSAEKEEFIRQQEQKFNAKLEETENKWNKKNKKLLASQTKQVQDLEQQIKEAKEENKRIQELQKSNSESSDGFFKAFGSFLVKNVLPAAIGGILGGPAGAAAGAAVGGVAGSTNSK